MRFISHNIFLQPFAVLSESEANTTSDNPETLVGVTVTTLSGTVPTDTNMVSVTGVLNQTFSSTPVIWESELAAQYHDVGEALNHMTSLDGDDHLMIEPPVYAAASFVAACLLFNKAPAPRVFTHGPKSVVFNWINGADNLYLTISADKLSILVSTPERIQTRVDLSAKDGFDPIRLLSSIPPELERQRVLLLPSGSSDPTDLPR